MPRHVDGWLKDWQAAGIVEYHPDGLEDAELSLAASSMVIAKRDPTDR